MFAKVLHENCNDIDIYGNIGLTYLDQLGQCNLILLVSHHPDSQDYHSHYCCCGHFSKVSKGSYTLAVFVGEHVSTILT
jgi:hypothetical protein